LIVPNSTETPAGANRAERSASVKRLRLGTCVAIFATLLASGCATGTATITGTLEGSDGHCLYVLVPQRSGTDRYWLRRLPSGYVAYADGLYKPDGSIISMGGSLTVSGALSWEPFNTQCAGGHTLDATAIN